jgi:hypothetical protein
MSEIVEIHSGFLMTSCPYDDCKTTIIVHRQEVNCAIFRCSPTLNPHAPKSECDAVIIAKLGCTRPFRINIEKMQTEICDYI